MFIHNLKYTVKILFKNKVLIFWMFAFPIILGIFFHMAFENIEKDEALQVFDIAVIDNKEYQNQTIYQETFKELSDKKNKDQLFRIHFVNKKEAEQLLEDNEIEGYVLFNKQEPQIVIKENGMEQTILQFVMDEIKQNKRMIEDLTKKQIEDEIQQGNYNFNVQQIVHDILQKLNNQEVSLKDTSSSHLSYMQIEYYTLIAMACMYGGMLGLTAINNQLANMSAKGKRVSVSPNKKGILVLSSALGSYLVSLVGLAILLIFLKFGLNVEFGSQWLYIIILSLVGDLAGISMGIFIASVFRVSEQAKTGINIAISMFFSVLSGMMGVTLKYVIDKNIPIVNLINPNNLITDGFYALYYYNTFKKLWGKYGFKDGFNLEGKEDWFAKEYIGIDKGIELLMIENYLNETIWKYFMRNEYVINGLKILGFTNTNIPLLSKFHEENISQAHHYICNLLKDINEISAPDIYFSIGGHSYEEGTTCTYYIEWEF